jgi:hypothetical protein
MIIAKLGDIARAKDIGKAGKNFYIWQACSQCRYERWVNNCPSYQMKRTGLCNSCFLKERNQSEEWRLKMSEAHKGHKPGNWKGEKIILKNGYTLVHLEPSDFFRPMADKNGYVMEHRLVYAQHLGRCLQSWEIVHHRNKKRNVKGEKDNSFINLQLTTRGQHSSITQMERKIDKLIQKVDKLQQEVRLTRWENKQLREEVQNANSLL